MMNEEIKQAINRVIDSGQFILGEEVTKLETEVAAYCGKKYAIGVNSGTDALYLALKAEGIGKGDEVITTPYTFIATAESIVRTGAKPVFVDINPETKNIDVSQIDFKVTGKTKAILPVHLFGELADMDTINLIAEMRCLKVIEDAAQAFDNDGVGTGDCTCFSFYPTKLLGGCGDGGMVVTDDKEVAERIKSLRNHGSTPEDKYFYKEMGVNSRLDEIQAAVIRIKLKHIEEIKKVYKHYPERYYPLPLHLQPAFKQLGYKEGDFPEAEKVAQEVNKWKNRNS